MKRIGNKIILESFNDCLSFIPHNRDKKVFYISEFCFDELEKLFAAVGSLLKMVDDKKILIYEDEENKQ